MEFPEDMGGICEDLYVSSFSNYNIVKGGNWFKRHGIADKLDIGVSVGSMGLGISLKTPVTKWASVRAGVDWMPRFSVPMYFNLNTYTDGIATGNFNQIAQILYNNTGILMDETVKMYGVGTMTNFRFIVDVYPIQKNRHWHLSAGFFVGTSRVGKAYNSYGEKPTLVALNIYNKAYEYFTNLESIFDVPLGGGVYMDPELVMRLQDKFHHYGRLGIHIGDFKDGTPYIMEPSPEGSVSAKAFVNHFKPYVGAGYSTALDKSGKWNFEFDLGVLFWGGEPDIINYDYTAQREINFTKDLVNIRGKVGDYVRIIKAFPVYPVVEFRFSYNIL